MTMRRNFLEAKYIAIEADGCLVLMRRHFHGDVASRGELHFSRDRSFSRVFAKSSVSQVRQRLSLAAACSDALSP
jgi:hypothetical protein